ncbi:TniQ family protein [Pararhizobium sp. O133]|uniref:TniQ family protein n=1 Tax=Pararhizobium sp. O133 TaxID=3449278 RepID=UPI003F6859D6
MNRLSLTVPFHPQETIPSFCSRLAVANGISSVMEFCWLLDLNHMRIINGDVEETEKLLQLAGVADLAGRRLTKTGVFYDINGETLARSSVVRGRLRYCPECIREDIDIQKGRPETRPYGRLEWCMTSIRTCPKHERLLYTADGEGTVKSFDFAPMMIAEMARLRDHRHPQLQPQSDFELFFARSLRGSREKLGWLDDMPLYAVGRVCEWIGATLLFGKTYLVEELSEADLALASQAGFDVVRTGQSGFETFLRSMHVDFWVKKTHTGGRALYGRLYERLAYESNDPAYSDIRTIMYNVALDSLPIGPGDRMFGPVKERRNHSIHSAAQEFRIHPKTLRKLLKNSQHVFGDLEPTDERIVLPANEMLALVDRLRGNLSTANAAEYIGASRTLWSTLVLSGHVNSSLGAHDDAMYPLYRTSDLDSFVDKIKAFATEDYDPSSAVTSLANAIKRANCKFSEVLDLLLGGKLKSVSVDPTKPGLRGLMLDHREISRHTRTTESDGLSVRQAAAMLITQDQVLRNLIKSGRLEIRNERTSEKTRTYRRITSLSLREFIQNYVSIDRLAANLNRTVVHLRRELTERGIYPAITYEEVGATFYRRSDL